jgi:hypothetical protein
MIIITDVSKYRASFMFRVKHYTKLKALRFFETFATIYSSARRNILEDFNLQQHLCDNLKSCIVNLSSDLSSYITVCLRLLLCLVFFDGLY